MNNPTNKALERSADTKRDWDALTPKQIEDIVDIGLRHKSGSKPTDYLNHWLSIARQFGFATHDDSWGELEKEFAIIIRRLVVAERNTRAQAADGVLELSLDDKTQINKRLAARYDFLMERHQHGHYETMFKCVHEELRTQAGFYGSRLNAMREMLMECRAEFNAHGMTGMIEAIDAALNAPKSVEVQDA